MAIRIIKLCFLCLIAVFVACSEKGDDTGYKLMLMEERGQIDRALMPHYLVSPDPEIRQQAARTCGIVRDRHFSGGLAKLSADKNEGVRLAAIFALGEIKDSSTATSLISCLDDRSADVRLSAIQAIGKMGMGSLAWSIRPFLRDTIPGLGGEAALASWRLADTSAVQELKAVARQRDSLAIYDAVYALFRLAPDSSIDIFLAVLTSSTDDLTRSVAARGLGAGKDTGAVLYAFDSYYAVSGPTTRIELIQALGRLATGRQRLESLLASASDQAEIAAIISALGAIGNRQSLPAVLPFLNHSSLEVRLAAIAALPGIDGREGVVFLEEISGDSLWQIRAAVARALGKTGERAAEKTLKLMLGDSDDRVRVGVIEGMGEFPITLNLELLEAALFGARDPVVRAVAADVLGASKNDLAFQSLVEASSKCDSACNIDLARSLVAALGNYVDSTLHSQEAISAIMPFLTFPDRIVRQDAASALGKWAPEDFNPGIFKTMFGPDDYEDIARLSRRDVVALIETRRGEIEVMLDPGLAPRTTANFVRLANRRFYDGLTFHRVVADFVIQGGCPRGDGWGGPGYIVREEINPRRFERGTIGMATSGRDTGGSQFFICFSDQPHLDGRYTAFGKVISGFEVMDKMEIGDTIFSITIKTGS